MVCLLCSTSCETLADAQGIVRYVPDNVELQGSAQFRAPFSVSGAHNVFLETIKRGEDDDVSATGDGSTTVVLRLYEAYGGHAQVRLNIASNVRVAKASIVNLLEDAGAELSVMKAEGDEELGWGGSVKLKFRGFEVKTVKLVIGAGFGGWVFCL